MDLSDRRAEYSKHSLDVADLAASPFAQFETWFRQAEECGLDEPNAFCLASVNSAGQPSTRVVLLKDFSDQGFVFIPIMRVEKRPSWNRIRRRLRISFGCHCSDR